MNSSSQKKARRTFSALLAAAGLFALAGCAGETYATGGVAYYDYDYYPNWDVYYYPHDRVYYWHDGEHWRSGHGLPNQYRLREEQHEHLQLHTRQPWTEHQPEHQQFQGHYHH